MYKTSSKNLPFIPASHEDKNNPGVLKKILLADKDVFINGKLKMINWAKLGKGRNFEAHFHEDMDEIFIIISGKVMIEIGEDAEILEKGDLVVIPQKKIHKMKNIGKGDTDYIAIGLSLGRDGKTIVVS